MSLLAHQQATDGAHRIDGHLTDGVDGQVVGSFVQANGGKNLDRLSDVAQDLPPTRLVEHLSLRV